MARPVPTASPVPPRRRRRLLWPLVAVLALGAAACTDGPGDEDDLVTALTRNDAFTVAEAECIASAVFAEYGEDEEALSLISGAGSYEDLTGPNGVDGFDTVFNRAINACANT